MRDRVVALIARARLPVNPPDWPAQAYLEWMAHDKKSKAGHIRYVVLRSMGQATMQPVDDLLVTEVLQKAIASSRSTGA